MNAKRIIVGSKKTLDKIFVEIFISKKLIESLIFNVIPINQKYLLVINDVEL